MTELERALLHIKTRADAWAVKEVEKALSQEQKIKAIVVEWQSDTWTDNFSYECMRKIADIVAESEE